MGLDGVRRGASVRPRLSDTRGGAMASSRDRLAESQRSSEAASAGELRRTAHAVGAAERREGSRCTVARVSMNAGITRRPQ